MDGCDDRLLRHPGRVLGKRLRDDPQLLGELEYCVPLGIPHSEFLGWDEDDQDKAVAYGQYQRTKCDGCGTAREDWTHPDAYIADVEICPGCERLEQERENDVAKARGAKVGLLPRDVALAKIEEYAE